MILGSTFILIIVARLDEMSKLDKIVELGSGVGGFFIGSIFLSYGLSFVSYGLTGGYLLYYSTVTIIICDYEIVPPSNS